MMDVKNSIVDYNNAKKDVNGGVLKKRVKDKITGQSYERYGHLVDCLRYITVWVFKDEYTRFSLKRKRSKIKQENKDMRYFDMSKNIQGTRLVYFLPEYAGKFIIVSCYVNEGIYIDNSDIYKDHLMRLFSLSFLEGISPVEVLFESEKNYFP